ncbi:MAG TPA: CPBP family intramembrane metalloprotease [Firmicutes bacterium]|jgi:membrane protease YdiL (CAAX protease family)|nr:CPBP family intramembrane metalloprotease [Bacillota bacterium]
MRSISISTRIYIGLVITLALMAAVNIFLPQGSFLPLPSEEELVASIEVLAMINVAVVLILYGGLGFLGIILSKKLGFPDLWDSHITNRQRFFLPALVGAGVGLFFIVADLFFSRFHGLGALPHPPFPTSLVASVSAAIGEEIIFRLFFISFWVWLISHIILKKRWQNQVFWVIAVISALLFALGHLPSVMIMFGLEGLAELPIPLLAEIILLNGVLSVFAAHYFRKYGFLAPVGVHFWADIVWHVIWGLL